MKSLTSRYLRAIKRVALALLCAAAANGAGAGEWATVADSSTVTLYATKQGAWFDGVFEDFTATIDFDPAQPEAGRIIGRVNTTSFKTEDPQNETYVWSYLEIEAFPEARFESSRIEKTAEGFRATGDLTLKGRSNPATLDFFFEQSAAASPPASQATFWGEMIVNRFDFDIASDIDVSWTGRDVTVQVELDLRRVEPDR
jgi:polyisoprenoid-binding protein YceI